MRRLLTLALTLLMVVSLVLPPSVAAAAPSSPMSGVEKIDPQAKMAPELKGAFAKDEYVSYMVMLSEQTDPAIAAKSAKADLLSSQASAELTARVGVIRALKETANRTQGGVLSLLKTAQGNGTVKSFLSYYIINAFEVTSTKAVMEAIAGRPEVAKLWPNTKHLMIDPKKPDVTPDAVGPASTEWNISRIGAPTAWGLGYDGTGMVVANLDTGVDYTHPALARKWRGTDPALAAYSWFDAVNGRTTPYDDHAHGTHTMGTMVGSDPEGINQIGVAPGAQWIAAKILDADGYGTDANILAAAEWLLAPGGDPTMAPDAVNNSWGGGPGIDEWFRPAVQAWRSAGIFVEFAAGNSGPGVGSVTAPGNYPEAFTVGMVNVNEQLDPQSGRGPAPYPAPDDMKPDVVAPGVNIRSSIPGGGYQGGWGGTSMASPHVTASAALIKQANPSLSVDQIEAVLRATALPLGDAQYSGQPNYGYGWGRINVGDAVAEITTGRGAVTGRVLISGDDLEPPQVTHDPITLVYEGTDITLTVDASDNVSIVSVEAYVRPVGASSYTYVPLTLTSGDYKAGTYTGAAPWYLFDADYNAEYYIRVNDWGNNTYTSPKYQVDVEVGITPGYVQDFESAPNGWWHDSLVAGGPDPWQWGVPTSGPNAAHSGTKVYATNLSGQYANSTQAFLMAPPIDLTAGGPAKLSFWHWYELETNYDYGRVYVSTDGNNFTLAKQFNGLSNGWVRDTIDLTSYSGQVIYAMFLLQTDSSVPKLGWYIDDVALIGPDTIAPAAPTGLVVQPSPTGEPKLTWGAVPELDVTGYKVYRSATSGSGYTLIGNTPDSQTQFIDTTAANNVPNYYVVTAVDMGNNESPYSSEVSLTPRLPAIFWSNDFETGIDGWVTGGTGGVWQCGAPAAGAGGTHSGANVLATNLTPTYNNSAAYWIQTPVIDLTNYASAALSLWQWYELETNWDYGYIEISTNGGSTWTQLARYTGSAMSWAQPVIDLTPYVGAPVSLRFRLTTDSTGVRKGWLIDDMNIMGVQIASDTLEPTFTPSDKKETEYPTPTPDWSRVRTAGADAAQVIVPASLPALATVTVLQTGAMTRTSPATGAYTLNHAAGDYTLRAEAYGYYPADRAVTILDDATVTANFILAAIPSGTLVGRVVDQRTEAPIAGAELYLREDAHVVPVTTDANGEFALTGLAGDYTLHISSQGYYSADVPVTIPANSTTPVDVSLRAFIGYPGELAYDDGTPTNAYSMNSAGNGFGVRFSPGDQAAQLNTVSFLFWGTDWPTPGGTAFQYAIFDVNPDGTPGALLAGPFNATAIRNPAVWTTIDVSGLGLVVNGDFVVAQIQPNVGGNSPGMCVDEDTDDTGRNWAYVGGGWLGWIDGGGTGNIMIRASVLYPVGVPVITAPTNGACVNTPVIDVTGTASPNVTVNVYVGGALANSVTADAKGDFTAAVTIADGANTITVDASVDGKYTDPSPALEVILDRVNPTIDVTPADGFATNQSAIVLVVTGADEHLSDTITVAKGAAAPAQIKNSGGTEWRVPVELIEGANPFTVTVFDRAGNFITTNLTITRDSTAPLLTNLTPATNVSVAQGQTVTVSFDSEPGLTAGYMVILPSQTASGYAPMTETTADHYTATWTAPNGVVMTGAEVEFRATDSAGNVTEATAAGKITVTAPVVGDLTVNPATGQYLTNGNDTVATGKTFLITGTVSSTITGLKVGKTRVAILNGTFSYQYSLTEGLNNIILTATKKDGTTITKTWAVTLDSTCTVGSLKATQVTGNYLQVTGKTDPGATVVVKVMSGTTAVDTITVTAGSDGAFTAYNTVAIAAGRYTVVVTATDALGNTGTGTISLNLRKPAPVR